jgi:hypothetical protein
VSSFKLNLPTDIPWERVCVSKDMMDERACDDVRPKKWSSSLAIYKYQPAEEYQLYPGRSITYLKVAATITGHHPREEELEQEIDFDRLSIAQVDLIEEILDEYVPCSGALLQLTVAPPEVEPAEPEWTTVDFGRLREHQPSPARLGCCADGCLMATEALYLMDIEWRRASRRADGHRAGT